MFEKKTNIIIISEKIVLIMRSEEECPKEERYLFCDIYLSDIGIELSQKEVIKRFTNRDKDDLYYKYITWKKNNNEIIVFTMYAYADLKLNKEFDCIFNYDNPDEFVIEKFVITQSLYEGWAPIDTVEEGHKHLIVLKFKSEIPKIIFKLRKEDTFRDTGSKIYAKLGFCDKDNFESISKDIKKKKETYQNKNSI